MKVFESKRVILAAFGSRKSIHLGRLVAAVALFVPWPEKFGRDKVEGHVNDESNEERDVERDEDRETSDDEDEEDGVQGPFAGLAFRRLGRFFGFAHFRS